MCHIQGFDGESWKKGPLDRTRHRWEDNAKVGLIKVGCESVHWIHLIHMGVSDSLLQAR